MAKKKINVSLLLDETGSMMDCFNETISGFNKYIEDLRKDKKSNYSFSLTKFNSMETVHVYDGVSVSDVKDLSENNYQPAAMTPLYDAIGIAITKIGKKKNVLFVILTDGQENSSGEYNRKMIADLISKKEKDGWSFIYLGANQDAFAVGNSLGIQQGNISNYNVKNTEQAFNIVSRGTIAYATSSKGMSAPNPVTNFFDEEDQEELIK